MHVNWCPAQQCVLHVDMQGVAHGKRLRGVKLCMHRHGDVEAVQDFVAIGRNVNEQDQGGRSPLHYAVAYAHGDIVDELLEAGASLAAQVLAVHTHTRAACAGQQDAQPCQAGEGSDPLLTACRTTRATRRCTMRVDTGTAAWRCSCWRQGRKRRSKTAAGSCRWISLRALLPRTPLVMCMQLTLSLADNVHCHIVQVGATEPPEQGDGAAHKTGACGDCRAGGPINLNNLRGTYWRMHVGGDERYEGCKWSAFARA